MRFRYNGKFWIIFVFILCHPLFALRPVDTTSLNKFLSAGMYPEAYQELLRCELQSEKQDYKLVKLKKDMLAATRRDVTAKLKLKPEDPLLNTILADLDYQENQLDRGIAKISKVLERNPTAISHFILAKLLFGKGNIQQSFEAMEKAFQADPTSEAILADFQFLYNCKNYGVATAKKLSQNTDFIKRAEQAGSEKQAAVTNESPFENDPTVPPVTIVPPEPEPEPDPLLTAKPPDTHRPPEKLPKPVPEPEPVEPVEPGSGTMEPPDEPTPPKIVIAASEPAVVKPLPPEEDPEKKKMLAAEGLLKDAGKKLDERAFEDAQSLLVKVKATFPGLPGIEEFETKLKKTIDESKQTEQEYLTSVKLFESEKYDLALKGIQKGFDENPKKHPEAKFYLGKIYVCGTERDLKKARKYFDLCLKDSDIDPDLKREIEWIIIGILTDNEEYPEAYQRFTDFESREMDYARSRNTYKRLKYLLWYENYATEVHIGLGLFLGAFLIVFILKLFPSIGFMLRDPLKRARAAMEKKQYEKAVDIAEDALRRGIQAVEVQRALLEICVEVHYNLKNYFKCQDHAKHLMNISPDNPLGWKFLTLTYLETKATHDEAIAMYEESYRRDPENKAFLPFLAKHYASQKQFTVESLGIMYDYFEADKSNRENVLRLAEAYVETKRMSEEAIPVLEEALKDKPEQATFRELLARNFAKINKYAEAVRECLKILSKDVNNMGIHVVYTSSMKKQNMLEEAVLQYEEFSKRFPGNNHIAEVLTELRKELEQTTGGGLTEKVSDELSPFTEEMIMDDQKIPVRPDDKVELPAEPKPSDDFIEPALEGFDQGIADVPLPDFLKEASEKLSKISETVPVKETKKPRQEPVKAAAGSDSDSIFDELLGGHPTVSQPREPSGSDDILEKILAEDGGRKSPPPKAGSSKKESKPSKEKPKTASSSGGFDDLLASSDLIPDELLGDSEGLSKDLLGDSEDDDVFASAKGIADDVLAGSGDIPDELSPDSDDLNDITGVDPFGDDAGGGMDKEIESLLTGKPKPAGKPSKAAEKPAKKETPSPKTQVKPARDSSPMHPKMNLPSGEQELSEARRKVSQKKYDEAVGILAPVFAINRNRSLGILLADCYLKKKEPDLAKEILETLEGDREMVNDEMKDILYRVGLSLEERGDVDGALKLYDIICNVDINFQDAFDRSDRLYSAKKKG